MRPSILPGGFARTRAVDLWYREDGTYRLLKAYRPAISRSN